MVEIEAGQIESVIEKAIKKIKNEKDFQLVSITNKIKHHDPLAFFEGGKEINKCRTFWTSSQKDFYLVGIGQAYEMTAGNSRFKDTKYAWQQLMQNATIYNPYESAGTGMVALGGMEFDPMKEKTEQWGNFPASHFTIPEFLLTIYNNECYYTINILVRKNDHPQQLANEMKQQENLLFAKRTIKDQRLIIKDKQEIGVVNWKNAVRMATEKIRVGEAEKVVLAREMRLMFHQEADITSIIQKLIATQPNSYIFAFEREGDCFVGATPERLVKREKNRLLSTCLAGTAPRGITEEEDKKISQTLMNDQKNRQEHDFVVQMIKQAMVDYCTDVEIPEEPVIYPLKNLQHLYTPVTATLKQGYSIFDIVEKLHPTPALGGTPREESMAFIREHEQLDRGWYGAPIGWIDSNMHGEFAVAIRSALMQGNEASLFAGCGVIRDSDPDAEYEETNIKFLPMLSVLGGQ
ncbi:isochorismate synthase [Oceanobacillus senegalensis]|uniref:isochorismate synthase n=1 Tax=Oceanobacillus senegalensis TaxID=1936063 RepID=UPI000A3136D5|nr:isochorismate synthase [Oceanobacillus senegalensis]